MDRYLKKQNKMPHLLGMRAVTLRSEERVYVQIKFLHLKLLHIEFIKHLTGTYVPLTYNMMKEFTAGLGCWGARPLRHCSNVCMLC